MTARDVDFIKQGDGSAVILIHSSVAGARQWLSLMNALADRFHLISLNHYRLTPAGLSACCSIY